MKIAILGLSITSSWGNGHATTYRALVRALAVRGHDVVFLEREAPWYAENRDLPNPPYCRTRLYSAVAELETRHLAELQSADLIIVGSYVPDGIAIGDLVHRRARGISAFYDIDTPITLARLKGAGTEYLTPGQIPRYDLYLSFTGGPTLEHLEEAYGARLARPLHCSVDPDLYYPEHSSPSSLEVLGTPLNSARKPRRYDLGYLGTYSEDRQPILDRLMLRGARQWPAGRFIVAGPRAT